MDGLDNNGAPDPGQDNLSGEQFASSRAVPYGAAEMNALSQFERETMGRVDAVLNALTGYDLRISNVECVAASRNEIVALLSEDLLFSQQFSIGETLTHYIALDPAFAGSIASSLTGAEHSTGATLDDMELSAVLEVVTQAFSTYLAQLGQRTGMELAGEPAEPLEAAVAAAQIGEGGLLATIELQNSGERVFIRHLIPEHLADLLLESIENSSIAHSESIRGEETRPAERPQQSAAGVNGYESRGSNGNGSNGNGHHAPAPAMQYQPAQFGQLAGAAELGFEPRNMGILLDVPLEVTVELGKTFIAIRQILEYGQGSLITLDKLAGEPIDLLVNGKYFARGEVVVIDENFGVRITSILSPEDRIAQLG